MGHEVYQEADTPVVHMNGPLEDTAAAVVLLWEKAKHVPDPRIMNAGLVMTLCQLVRLAMGHREQGVTGSGSGIGKKDLVPPPLHTHTHSSQSKASRLPG